jgi:hypothetical protein
MVLPPFITLLRIEDNFKYGVFGNLLIGPWIFCVTLEPKEYENKPNISCIPPGNYVCERIISPKFGTTYEVTGVPDRSNILFHAGNIVEDTSGCIILAEKFGKLEGDRTVLNSGITFTKFLNTMGSYNNFNLLIKETWA